MRNGTKRKVMEYLIGLGVENIDIGGWHCTDRSLVFKWKNGRREIVPLIQIDPDYKE